MTELFSTNGKNAGSWLHLDPLSRCHYRIELLFELTGTNDYDFLRVDVLGTPLTFHVNGTTVTIQYTSASAPIGIAGGAFYRLIVDVDSTGAIAYSLEGVDHAINLVSLVDGKGAAGSAGPTSVDVGLIAPTMANSPASMTMDSIELTASVGP
jgi:hypothetical protein